MELNPAVTITGVDSLDTNPMFIMGLAHKQFRAEVAQELATVSNITLEMFGALRILHQHGQITQQQLSDRLLRNRSVTKRLVDNTIKLGLVEASKSATNKKIKLLTLTEAGQQELVNCGAVVDRVNQQFCQGLSGSERQQLLQLLAKLVRTDLRVD